MSVARDEILGRVRGALADARPAPEPERAYRHRGALARPDLADLLAGRIAEYRAIVHRTGSAAIADVIQAICVERGVVRLGVPPGLPAAWRPAGVELVEDTGLDVRELDRLD
ncbi:MAG: lactate utilization protein C, partial [Actinomycetota bacterium]